MKDIQHSGTWRKVRAMLLSWLVFIGIDFLFHASLLAPLWEEDIPAFRSREELALLIPAGYLSFLCLTGLIGFVFFRFFRHRPALTEVLNFGLGFGFLFAAANLLGTFSYLEIPMRHLIAFNLVYLVEIIGVALCLYHIMFAEKPGKPTWIMVLIFFLLIVLGIIIQNVL